MKVASDIDFKNSKAFKKGVFQVDSGENSYFTVKKGEDLSVGLKEQGYSAEQIKDVEIRILKGNPSLLVLEDKVDVEKAEKVKKDKVAYEKRRDDLMKLNKHEQTDLLKNLDAKKIPKLEADRVKLIMKLEK